MRNTIKTLEGKFKEISQKIEQKTMKKETKDKKIRGKPQETQQLSKSNP